MRTCPICGDNAVFSKRGVTCGRSECVHEMRLIRSREYNKTHPSRETPYLKLRFFILDRDNFTCQYCGRKAPDVELQVDHIIPKAKGGEDIEENLLTACVDCNLGKSDSMLSDRLRV